MSDGTRTEIGVKALVVDDEPHARSLLRSILNSLEAIQEVVEAADGPTAVSLLSTRSFDLVLLDVQMPEMDGFEVVAAVGPSRMPPTVFVTAYDRYATRAFEVHALDYVLKPYDRARIVAAVARALAQPRDREAQALTERLVGLLEQVRSKRAYANRIAVRTANGIRLVSVSDVSLIEADDKMLRLHIGSDILETRGSIRSLEEQLDPDRFVRVHRSAIVNVGHVQELQPWFQGDFIIVLRNGDKVTSGRTYRDRVGQLLRGAALAGGGGRRKRDL